MTTFDEHNGTLFIHKYQPAYFDEFEMNEQLFDILKTLISMDNLKVLFIGDTGSGKTTLLNSIIREYYRGYEYASYCGNILHINSLKEQGINYYRNDVKTFCQTCCSIKNKKKIVILDDLDLINEQSQQVFRNCLDKFPHNVHFISSCNNIQKVIESLQSRFTIIKMQPLQRIHLFKIMDKISHHENIAIRDDAREFVLDMCNNTAKILINYMEKFKLLNQEISLELASHTCTNISFTIFTKFTHLIHDKKLNEAIKVLYDVHDKGYSVMDILDNYFLFVKTSPLLSETEKYRIIPIICKYITLFHNVHEDEIELALFTNNLMQA
jgi:DNA polymerase III delta prime subunit